MFLSNFKSKLMVLQSVQWHSLQVCEICYIHRDPVAKDVLFMFSSKDVHFKCVLFRKGKAPKNVKFLVSFLIPDRAWLHTVGSEWPGIWLLWERPLFIWFIWVRLSSSASSCHFVIQTPRPQPPSWNMWHKRYINIKQQMQFATFRN